MEVGTSAAKGGDAGAAPGPRLMVRADGTTCSLFEFTQLLRVPSHEPLPAPELAEATGGDSALGCSAAEATPATTEGKSKSKSKA